MAKARPWSQVPSSMGTVGAGFAHDTSRLPADHLPQINPHRRVKAKRQHAALLSSQAPTHNGARQQP